MTDNRQVKATPPDELANLFMDPNRAKTEAEHWAVREVENLRAENERLRAKDTKTRHALKGWVWVCPDGGDEPTRERVAAVVAEVGRLHRAHQSACEGGDLLREEVERLLQAIGLATTTVPDMQIDVRDPVGMMRRVVAEVEKLRVEVDHERKSHRAYARLCEETENQLEAAIERLIRERDEALAGVERLREVLIEWDALIQHQYSGSRDAMTDMQYAALRTKRILDELDARKALEAKL